MKQKRPTSKDVARLSGVSQATVSLVFNKREGRVSEAVRQKVLDAAAELNYIPNPVARGLKRRRNNTIAFVVPNFLDPLSVGPATGIELEARRRGYEVILAQSPRESNRSIEQVEHLCAGHVDGIIILQTSYMTVPPLLPTLLKFEIPFAYINAYLPDPSLGSYVHADTFGAAYQATQHLVEVHRKTRIAFFGCNVHGEPVTYLRGRALAGYAAALKDANLPLIEDLVPPDEPTVKVNAGREMCRKLLSTGSQFSGIVTINDYIAAGAMQMLAANGISVPGDVAVIGAGNLPFIHDVITPSLTTTDFNLVDVGHNATKHLIDAIELDAPGPKFHITVPSHLIVRSSCGCTGSADKEPEHCP